MKDLRIFVCAVALAIFLLPCCVSAQGVDPPTCCNVDGGGPHSISIGGSETTSSTANQIVITDESLRTLGISRSDLVDRLAGSLFFGKNVDIIISMTRSLDWARSSILRGTGEFSGEKAAAVGTLLTVQEKRTYQIPRVHLQAADIDSLDRFYITDGQISIEVIFKKIEPAAAVR
jgi:hypothetical protein